MPGFETKPSWKEIRYRIDDPGKCGSQYGRKRIANGVSLVICRKRDGSGWMNQALRFDKGVFPTIAEARAWYNANWRGNEAMWGKLAIGEYTDEEVKVLAFEIKERKLNECVCPECEYEMETDKPCDDIECPECGAVMESLSEDVPYVLSKESIETGWIPPHGFSTLTQKMENGLLERYHYWKEEDEAKRIEVRNNLAKDRNIILKVVRQFDDTHYLAECEKCEDKMFLAEFEGDTKDGIVAAECTFIKSAAKLKEINFVLTHHYWKGAFTTLTGGDVEHYDLFLGNKQLVMVKNPMLGRTNLSIRKPYSRGFSKKGLSKTEYIKPGMPGNPTTNTASYVKQMDSGKVIMFVDEGSIKRMEFRGKKLSGLYQMIKPIDNKNLWKFEKVKIQDGVKAVKLSKGESIRTICLSGKFQNIKKLDDGSLEVESITLGEGVWNCELYSREAIADRPERVLGTPVFVGTHSARGKHGETIEHKLIDGRDLWTKDHITHADGIRKLESGDYKGPSVEVRVIADDERHIITRILNYDRIVYVENPACEVCKVE